MKIPAITLGDLRSVQSQTSDQRRWSQARDLLNRVMVEGQSALPDRADEALLILVELIQIERPALSSLINLTDAYDGEPVAPVLSAALHQMSHEGHMDKLVLMMDGDLSPLRESTHHGLLQELRSLDEEREGEDAEEDEDEEAERYSNAEDARFEALEDAFTSEFSILPMMYSGDPATALCALLPFLKTAHVGQAILSALEDQTYDYASRASHNSFYGNNNYDTEPQQAKTPGWPIALSDVEAAIQKKRSLISSHRSSRSTDADLLLGYTPHAKRPDLAPVVVDRAGQDEPAVIEHTEAASSSEPTPTEKLREVGAKRERVTGTLTTHEP